MNISMQCVTFDQPLWYKASGIIAKKKLNIICRLGGFHTLTSFLGAAGDMMSGSGIVASWCSGYHYYATSFN